MDIEDRTRIRINSKVGKKKKLNSFLHLVILRLICLLSVFIWLPLTPIDFILFILIGKNLIAKNTIEKSFKYYDLKIKEYLNEV